MSPDFDFRHPEYGPVFQQRMRRLARIRDKPSQVPLLRTYYREHPDDFINDWACTYDPRNVERGLPAVVPFLLFPRQREWIRFIVELWKGQQDGLTEKSRDMGISWLAVSLAVTLCLHHEGVAVGFGSKTEDDIDKSGDPDTLFWKARQFLDYLPKEFRGGFDRGQHSSHMLLTFPQTKSTIKGDAGDNIGRGGRSSLYFIDEAAHLARPTLVDAALAQTTNCRQDISTPRGRSNPFAEKRFSGRFPVFTFHWREDPRKDDAWYERQQERLDPVTLAQEIDLDYTASIEGVLIPSAWVQAAVDAHERLAVFPSGARMGALDVADEGRDLNAFVGAHGVVVERVEQWSGKGADIFTTVQRTFGLCDEHGYRGFRFDSDGLGAGVRGDARVINEMRGARKIEVTPFRGSGPVEDPEAEDVQSRKNKDYFLNAKAQSWWALRTRFQKTHRWVVDGERCDPDDIISLPSKVPNIQKLMAELSQPTYSISAVGKLVVDKAPDGARSPNLADGLMIRYARTHRTMRIDPNILQRLAAA